MKNKIITTPDHYFIKNKKYDRVTRVLNSINEKPNDFILSRYTYDGFKNMVETAGEREKAFHIITAKIDTGKIKSRTDPKIVSLIDDNLKKRVLKYFDWFEYNVSEVIASELTIYDDDLMIAGTADLICILKGEKIPRVIEKKTCAEIKKKHYLQTNKYMKMYGARKGMIVQSSNGINPIPMNYCKIANKVFDDLENFQTNK